MSWRREKYHIHGIAGYVAVAYVLQEAAEGSTPIPLNQRRDSRCDSGC
jgi:hypothetical protein